MKKIVIQAGHINCQNNSIVVLRKNTGAPGEQELNLRIANRLSAILRGRGFEVKQTDACANDDPKITKQDYDLFLALHGDADAPNDKGGGFADFPEPSTDGATKESQRVAKVVNDNYFAETKIVYKNGSNANTRFYYMWKFLSAKTPCVLVEMGQVQDPHDKVLLANTDLIANALGGAICKAFGVAFDTTGEDELLSLRAEVVRLGGVVDDLNKTIVTLKTQQEDQLATVQSECRQKIETIKTNLLTVINNT